MFHAVSPTFAAGSCVGRAAQGANLEPGMSLAYSTMTGRSADERQKSASTSSGESCLVAGTLRHASSAFQEASALALNLGSV